MLTKLEIFLNALSMALKDEARGWMEKAKSDLKHAKSSLELGDHDWTQLASQQAAEKALKSVCISKGIGLMRVHDLTVLARKLDAPRNILEQAGLLNPFYAASRYPDVEMALDEKQKRHAAEDAVSSATNILQWCKKQMRT